VEGQGEVHREFWWGNPCEGDILKTLAYMGREYYSGSSRSRLEGMEYIGLAWDRYSGRLLLNLVMNLWVLKNAGKYLSS